MIEISDDIELRNGKSNPFGWSQHEIWYDNQRIGWIESGDIDLNDGYTYTEEKDNNRTRVKIFKTT